MIFAISCSSAAPPCSFVAAAFFGLKPNLSQLDPGPDSETLKFKFSSTHCSATLTVNDHFHFITKRTFRTVLQPHIEVRTPGEKSERDLLKVRQTSSDPYQSWDRIPGRHNMAIKKTMNKKIRIPNIFFEMSSLFITTMRSGSIKTITLQPLTYWQSRTGNFSDYCILRVSKRTSMSCILRICYIDISDLSAKKGTCGRT